MKKVFVICILAALAASMTACTGVPKNATGSPVPETAGNSVTEAQPALLSDLPPEPEFEPDTLSLGEIEEPASPLEPLPPETASQIALPEEPPPIAEETAPLPPEPSSPPEPSELTEAETGEIPADIAEALPFSTEAPTASPPAVTPTPVTPPAPPPVTVSVPVTPPAAVSSPSTPPLAAVVPAPATPPRAAPPPATPTPATPSPATPAPATTPSFVERPVAPRPFIPIQNAQSPEDPAEVFPPEVEAEPSSLTETPSPAETPPRDTVPRIVSGTPFSSSGVTGRENEDVVFSRTVRIMAGQTVEIPFRGTGWVYLGETGGRQGVFYESRRIDPEGQSFIFRVDLAGEYSLKFYRQDFIRNFIFNDYVKIIAEAAPETAGRFGFPVDRGRVVAEPRWPSTIEEAAAIRGRQQVPAATDTAQPADTPSAVEAATPPLAAVTPPVSATPPPAATPTVTPPTPAATTPATPARVSPPVSPTPPPATAPVVPTTPPPSTLVPAPVVPPSGAVNGNTVPEQPAETSPYAYLEKAGEEYTAGRIVSAISFLDRFKEYFPSGSDEAWWLYGQCYEANSPARDILVALDYYRRLLQEYPQSIRSEETRRRIRYLERLYINIR